MAFFTSKCLTGCVCYKTYDVFIPVRLSSPCLAVSARRYPNATSSTIIMLKASYLEGMTVGSHTIEILYTDGAAAGSFSIAPAPATGNSPATGDSGQVALWSSIALISLAAAAAWVLGKKRFTV